MKPTVLKKNVRGATSVDQLHLRPRIDDEETRKKRINEMISKSGSFSSLGGWENSIPFIGLKSMTYKSVLEEKKKRNDTLKDNSVKIRESQERKWLSSCGKKHLIDFDDKERGKLKQYFASLDLDGSGSIGIEELEEPLISLGIAETREQVRRIVDLVDKDGSHQIEFGEFIAILKAKNQNTPGSTQNDNQSAAIIEFFKGLISSLVSCKHSTRYLLYRYDRRKVVRWGYPQKFTLQFDYKHRSPKENDGWPF